MSDIDWKDGAVCYGDGRQWFVNTGCDSEKFELVNNDGMRKYSLYGMLNYPNDFQLNEIRIGDFITASELDTEQKYNEVVEVFGLFGFEKWEYSKGFANLKPRTHLGIDDDGEILAISTSEKRQLTYHQIIAIGKLKRMMLEREKSNHSEFPDSSKRNKSKQAYDILKSLDYEYDLVKQRWYEKRYID